MLILKNTIFKYMYKNNDMFWLFVYIGFNVTFNKISVISWRSVLVEQEDGVPESSTDLGQVTDKLDQWRYELNETRFCMLQSQVPTHAV